MVHILCRPWWSRAWILQEMAYAKSDPLIMFGRNFLPARVLYRVFKQFHDRIHCESNPISVEDDEHDDCTVLLWRARLSPAMHSIADLLQLTSGQVASDPRDKVFAFQSLMMEPMRSAFAPDYGKSTASIYTRLATYLLCIEKWSRLYREFPIGVDKTSPDRPSWVPDFSDSCHDEICAQLWADAPPLKIRDLEAVVDFGMLVIRGVYCGQVVAASALKPMHEAKFLVGGLAAEAKGPLSCLLQSTLEVFGQGKENKEKDDLQELYLAVRARPQSSFFTMQDLKVFISDMSQGLPCRTNRLVESRSSEPGTTEYDEEILDALASDVRQTRKRLSEKWMNRFDRLGLFMSKQGPNILPPKTERLVQQYEEDLQQSRMKYRHQKKSYYERNEKKFTDQVALDHIMFTTDTGLAGVGPSTTRPGDSVVVLYGIDTAFIARQIGDSQTMVLVGMVWLH
ncbi:unnamed protein product [Clonostachys solani]|uniref:Heterokaryon incompatibility domain-containing protein n=1 Tax=Clonostachys solani TaxID=160281 RepID=A0A9N9ZK68_9HYPO|nr:unnamed protein product [Clonostachys solani]